MAALVNSFAQQATISDALSGVAEPGTNLLSVELRENSHGEPAYFITYAVDARGRTDEEQAKILLKLLDKALNVLNDLNLPFFSYVDFLPK